MDQDKKYTFDDVVFEGRPNNFGAYRLRKDQDRNVLWALLAGISLAGGLMVLPLLAGSRDSVLDDRQELVMEIDMEKLPPQEKQLEVPPPPPPAPQEEKPKKATVKYLPPKVTQDEQVTEELPTVDDLVDNDPGEKDQEGVKDLAFTPEPPATVVEEQKPAIRDWVPDMPEFPGGEQAYLKFFSKHVRYPEAARESGVEGTVNICFIVNEHGKIGHIEVLGKGLGHGLDQEAIRVFKMMPAWKVGKLHGKAVPVRVIRPVTFKLM